MPGVSVPVLNFDSSNTPVVWGLSIHTCTCTCTGTCNLHVHVGGTDVEKQYFGLLPFHELHTQSYSEFSVTVVNML